jgi:hypothetical protein
MMSTPLPAGTSPAGCSGVYPFSDYAPLGGRVP